MKINCLIVEDEPLARNLMTAYVEKVPYLNLLKACSNPLDAIDFLRDNSVDLLFYWALSDKIRCFVFEIFLQYVFELPKRNMERSRS